MSHKTTVVFDYGTQEFAIGVDGMHVEPTSLTINTRRTATYVAGKNEVHDWIPMSAQRFEVRHEGMAPARFERIDWDALDVLMDAVDRVDLSEWEECPTLAAALEAALTMVPGWYEPLPSEDRAEYSVNRVT